MSCIRALLAAAAVAGTALMSPAFAADFNYWSSPAVGCMPVSSTVDGVDYIDAGVGGDQFVSHKAGNVDPIAFICPVSRNGATELPNQLLMTYRDATGVSPTAFAKASLIRIDRATGNRTVIATVSSDSSPLATVNRVRANFTHAFNFVNAYYHVRIDMDRTAATQVIQVFGVQLNKV